jgi:hypothetical protein
MKNFSTLLDKLVSLFTKEQHHRLRRIYVETSVSPPAVFDSTL